MANACRSTGSAIRSSRADKGLLLALALLLTTGVVWYGGLCARTPAGRFTQDSMNYVDVARNIAAGRGIAQSTLGFNEPRFSPDWAFPRPLTAQPPLYPLLIALLGLLGVSFESAALGLSAVGYGLVLLASYLLARRLYDLAAALAAVLVVGSLAPLFSMAGMAWADTLGTGFVLLALWLLVRARQAPGRPGREPFLAGWCCGLAFATRYALLPVLVAAVLLLWESSARRRTLRQWGLLAAGCALPIVLVVGHNLSADGTLLGPARNPSDVGLWANLRAVYDATVCGYLGRQQFWMNPAHLGPGQQAVLAGGLLLVAVVVLRRRRGLREALLGGQRHLPLLWSACYLALLVGERTRTHFDPISARLTLPATVALAIVMAGLLTRASRVPARYVACAAVLWTLFAGANLLRLARSAQGVRASVEQALAQSPRLAWIAAHVTSRDLVIGMDAVDVPFFFLGRRAVSFSSYPYTDHVDYGRLLDFARRHCAEYDNFYLVLRGRPIDERGWRTAYGSFIADLRYDRLSAYPAVSPVATVRDGLVFRLQCR